MTMKNAVISSLFLLAAVATANPSEVLAPFGDASLASLDERFVDANDTSDGLQKRQSGCVDGYSNCYGQGAPGLCCRDETVCSVDSAGRVGCCPVGAVCTGTLGPGVPTPTSGVSFVFPTTTGATSTQGFIIADPTDVSGAGYSRSTVPNQYYPYAYIPTTYTNAAACSSAYTSCQADAASCTSALAGGNNGVTVVAPNGGVTVHPITATLDVAAASSVCASLSSQACYGLQVAACASFGGDSGAGGSGCQRAMYGVGAGVAIGVAGQLL